MKSIRLAAIILAALSTSVVFAADGVLPRPYPARLQWWADARFGMFIHWGPVTLKETEISWSRANSNPKCPNQGKIPVDVYDNLYKEFNPTKFDAKEWVAIAKAAGMKYMVLTVKHCDGFLLWDSNVSDYNIMNTPFKRDVAAELAKECHEQGMKIGWYFSPMDWRDPDCRSENNDRFVKHMREELRELLTNYGKIDLLWFDYDDCPPVWDQEPTYAMIKKLQPHIVINNRFDIRIPNGPHAGMPESIGPHADYYTPEQSIGGFDLEHPWESCMTTSRRNQWTWGGTGDGVKTFPEIMTMLIGCAGGDGNVLLNVGPTPAGVIAPEQANLIKQVGDWLAKYGESIYGTRGGPFKPGEYGVSTRKGKTIYVHIRKWSDGSVKIPAIPAKIVGSRTLTGGTTDVQQTESGIEISVPEADRQPIDTIVALELDVDANTIPAVDVLRPVQVSEKAKAVEDVWVVFKTHFDLGYTDRVENVLNRYRTEMMDNAIRNIEADRSAPVEKRFSWTVPGWPMKHILGTRQDPERREKIIRSIREGSLAIHALPGSLHTESFDLEDLVRGLGFSSTIARNHDRPLPIAAKMTDVPVHSWVLPTLLAHAGVKFFQNGCNGASQYPRVPPLFWWEGPDGSRILCNWTIEYGSPITPPANWPSKNYLALIMTGDNQGPPTAADVENIRAQCVQALPGVAVHFGTLDDFAKAVLAENPKLPIIRGDMPDTWIHGLLSMPIESKTARNIRPLEPAVDVLDTQLHVWGLKTTSLAEPLAKAYEQSFLYGEHTWGLNGTYGGNRLWGDDWKNKLPVEQQHKYLASFDDHRNYIRKTDEIIQRELASRLAILAQSVKAEGRRIVVFNPLPWPRSGVVAVNVDGNAHRLTDSQSGQSIPCDRNGKSCRFFAGDVPAGGYRTYLVPIAANSEPATSGQSSPTVIETPRFKATFDLRRGGLSSLVEKKTGREIVDQSSEYALGQYLHERFSEKEVKRFFEAYSRDPQGWAVNDFAKPDMPDAKKSPYTQIVPADWQMAVHSSPVEDIVTLTAGDAKGLAKGVSIVFAFPRDGSSIDVEWRIDAKTPNKIPEGGWLCFPFAVEKPRFLLGRPGGPVDPARDIVPGGNRHLAAVASGVAITDVGGGVGLCPIDSPLVSLDRPGLWRFSLDFTPEKPTVFVNLYNNMWNTNFPLWIDGSWTSRVRIWPMKAGNSSVAEDLAVQSWEARTPLLAAMADGPPGAIPTEQTGIRLSRPGVLVTAFGSDPDGNPGTLLRVWDQSGVAGQLTVDLPAKFPAAKAQPINLRGEKLGEPLAIISGKFTFDLRAFAPASLILVDR